MEQAAINVVKQPAANVVGAIRHPLCTSDFSSYVMKAQSSGAKVMGSGQWRGDTINAIKTAKEFGIDKKMKRGRADGLHHRYPQPGPRHHRRHVT
ncbi:ABC transporter substrate-binding protein [Comamonas sp. JC664]|uniref:ABC transporter substrate-binding protein n=1 Tax=Comamonas sp. JC664 TaxID=2801917 RepID=UPI00360C50A1